MVILEDIMAKESTIFNNKVVKVEHIVYSPVQLGGGVERVPSGRHTVHTSSSVAYPSIQLYVYMSRYLISGISGMLAVYIPGWGAGQVISRIYYNDSGERF